MRSISLSPPRRVARLSQAALRCAALLLAGTLLLAGCSTPASLHATKPSQLLQWPPRPQDAKIVWIKSISDYEDLGIAKGGWKRFLELLTGAQGKGLARPHGVLFDSEERLIVADPGAGVVHCMDVKRGRYTVIGRKGGLALHTPIGVTEDGEGRLYITDSGTGTVFVYDFQQEVLKTFLRGPLLRPTGIAYSKADQLIYIVDALANQVIAVDLHAREKKRIGGFGELGVMFNHPTDIAIDSQGQIYVTDPLNFRIKVFSRQGKLVREIGTAGDAPGTLDKPKGLAVDSDGHLYLADALLDVVQIFDAQGKLLLYFGANGTGSGEFWMPSGLYIDQNDFIFVADTYNHRIQVFRYLSDKRAVPGTTGGTGPVPAPLSR